MKVLVVLTNFKRPDNNRKIVQAFKRQSHQPENTILLDFNGDIDGMDCEIWRYPDPGGPACRFAPIVVAHKYDYILWHDDDLLPGDKCIEHYIDNAKKLNDKFATLGCVGRRFTYSDSRVEYVSRNLRLRRQPVWVDMTCRSHFVRADLAHHALRYMSEAKPFIDESELIIHDDFWLCLGIRYATRHASHLVRKVDDMASHSPRLEDLPHEGVGVSRDGSFIRRRNQILTALRSRGLMNWQT